LVQDQVGSLFTVWAPMTVATIALPAFHGWSDKVPRNRQAKQRLLNFPITRRSWGVSRQVLITWGHSHVAR